MAVLGISERGGYIKGYSIHGSNRKIFIKFWETYLSNRNSILKGYIEGINNRSCFLENEIISNDRNIQIPLIYIKDERQCSLIPICFCERKCFYKRYFIEQTDKKIYLIPVCFNERICNIEYWFSSSNNRYSTLKFGGSDIRYLLTQLPPHFTAYNYRNAIFKILPPNVAEKPIESPCFHVEYILPQGIGEIINENTDCFKEDLTIDTTGCGDEILDGITTDNVFQSNIIGLYENLDYGELFIADLENSELHNLSTDSLFELPIFYFGDYYTKNLYMISNQDNLLIRSDLNLNLYQCKEIYTFKWNEYKTKYTENEANEKFRIWCMQKLFNDGVIKISLLNKDISWDWEFYKKFPKRFLNKFEVFIKEEYYDMIFSINLIFYFPYRFRNMDKRREVGIIFNVSNM